MYMSRRVTKTMLTVTTKKKPFQAKEIWTSEQNSLCGEVDVLAHIWLSLTIITNMICTIFTHAYEQKESGRTLDDPAAEFERPWPGINAMIKQDI